MAKAWMALVLGGVLMATSGCRLMDGLARNEMKEGKVTKFVRTASGDVAPVEFEKTYTGKLIGPDGKVFRGEPTTEELRAAYGK